MKALASSLRLPPSPRRETSAETLYIFQLYALMEEKRRPGKDGTLRGKKKEIYNEQNLENIRICDIIFIDSNDSNIEKFILAYTIEH